VLPRRPAPARSWHLAAAAVQLLLGRFNLAFWPFFSEAGMSAVGYVTSALHALVAPLQLHADYAEIETKPWMQARQGSRRRVEGAGA